jgi:hypothetical protein
MEWKTANEFAVYVLNNWDIISNSPTDAFLNYMSTYNYDLYYQIKPAVKYGVIDKEYELEKLKKLYSEIFPKGYNGIMKEDGSSNAIHLDSIRKYDKPICWMSYNDDGYQSHCKQYKEYKDWEKKRNQARYDSNLEKNYDSKNIMHCVRLIQMGIELAKTGELNVDREKAGDRQFLLDIRNHKYEYDYLIDYCEKKKAEMDEAIKTCNLPEEIDKDFVNELLIRVRKVFDYVENR